MSKLLRPWRDRSFQLLALALCIAAFSLSAVVFLRAELEQRFSVRTAEALGGDLIITGTRVPEPQQVAQLTAFSHSHIVDFSTVLVHKDALLLVSARAVDNTYPLYGELQISDSRFAVSRPQQHGPTPGEVWVADQVIDRLKLSVGESLTVGSKRLKLSAIIRQLPDQNAGFYSMNPRIVFNAEDLKASAVMGPGTLISHHTVVATKSAALLQLREALDKTLRPDQRIETVKDAALRSMGPLRQLSLWANLAVLLISLLCGAAIYLATTQRVRRRAKLAGLLRSFGASRYQVITRLLGSEFLAVLPAAIVGSLLGIVIVNSTVGHHSLPALLGFNETPSTTSEWLTACLAPLLLWLAFALPRLSTLVRVPAIEVLRQRDQQNVLSANIELLAALAAPVLLAGLLTDSISELWQLLLLVLALGVLLPALLWPLIKGLDLASSKLALPARLAIRRLSRRPALTLPLLVSLTLAMAILTLAGQTGAELLRDWRTQLPERAPNHFALNLFYKDMPAFKQWLGQHQATAQPLYPVVRGRLTSINNIPVREAVTKESKSSQRHLNRDLSLTEANILPASNAIKEGRWHGNHTDNLMTGGISVEQEIADRLGLKMGDQLTFVTSRGTLNSPITSLREVDWNSFEPNFYFIFASGALSNEDITWITSFWLPEGDGVRLAELLRELPHITILDVKTLIDKAEEIIAQASQASALLGTLLMFSALLVLAAGLLGGQEQRGRDNALLRALGGRQRLIKEIVWIEFFCLTGSAALGATAISILVLYPLSERLFNQSLHLSVWQLLPLILAVLLSICGVISSRKALKQPALTLLRSKHA